MVFRRLAALVATAALVTACSSDAAANDADVAFARGMIPHHEQALEMADLVGDDSSPEVQDLADRIEAAQEPEIEQMQRWLEDWDVEDAGGGSHEGHDMAGMMDEEQMTDLETSSGRDFDRRWLELMVEHHEGAVQMSEEVLADGEDPDVAALAEEIIDAQQAEISEMEGLLDE